MTDHAPRAIGNIFLVLVRRIRASTDLVCSCGMALR